LYKINFSYLKSLTQFNKYLRSELCFVILFLSMVVSGYHYIFVKLSFFDDAFIYLNMAQNAVDFGTWQYFPVVDRTSLLASSPLKLVILSIGAKIISLIGVDARNILSAKYIFLLAGFIGWIVFMPFWWKSLRIYALIGSLYMLSASFLSASFDFEGGLLFLWFITLIKLLLSGGGNWALPVLLPAGALIRPDLSLLIYIFLFSLAATDLRVRKIFLKMSWRWLFVLPVTWIVISYLMSVFPIPVTYWGKASIPLMFENITFLEKIFERVGIVSLQIGGLSSRVTTMIGVVFLGVTAIVGLSKMRNPVVVGAILICSSVLIFGRMPANFWWYYENLVLLGLAVLVVDVLFLGKFADNSSRAISFALIFFILISGVCFKTFRDQQGLWTFSLSSNNQAIGVAEYGRSKGYLYLAEHSNHDGTYTLPLLGRMIIKNPEMGIISFFSGSGAWIWDSAGLAQPLENPHVQSSILRFAYPPKLRRAADIDAQAIVQNAGESLPVFEVWAMEDRDFDAASRSCKYVIKEGALCINPFGIIEYKHVPTVTHQ
jgi:hypothetical protein